MKPTLLYNRTVITISSALLIVLWSYTGLSKLLDFNRFEKQADLIFSKSFIQPLVLIVPILEILAAVSLSFKRSKTFGLYLSLILISAFTIYVLLVIGGYFGSAPCRCGGIISTLSWRQHLILNIAFLFIVIFLMVAQNKREEVAVTT